MKTYTDPLWTDTSGSNITLYNSKTQDPTKFAIYNNGDAESKDSAFEHVSAAEVDIKEHIINQSEETRLAAQAPSFDKPPPELSSVSLNY